MNYLTIENTFLSNAGGIMEGVMYFHLEKLTSNCRLYFYKYSLYDLVEINLSSTGITVYTFRDNAISGVDAIIKENLDFYSGYFKTAGLVDKRFLFDCKNKMPVTYDDFAEVDNLSFEDKQKHELFILDKKHGYITERKEVFLYISTDNAPSIDMSILSFANNLIGVLPLKGKLSLINQDTVMFTAALSGMLSGIKVEDIQEQIEGLDIRQKFFYPINKMQLGDEYYNKRVGKLKSNKFEEIFLGYKNPEVINTTDEEFNGKEIDLSRIIELGLDRFIRLIKTPEKVVHVRIDVEWQSIISMYIVKGAAFITPGNTKNVSNFREMFDSENFTLVMN